jgi:hypothetical protein
MLNVRRWTFIFYQHLALYAVEEAKVAILEAMAARKEADGVK